MREEFNSAVKVGQELFGVRLTDENIERLADYYELILQHNPLLHLVAPASPEEFAARHILESLTLLEFLPKGARIADIGTGAGLPSLPCLLVREDLSGLLIESKLKKAEYLTIAAEHLGVSRRAAVFPNQFDEVRNVEFTAVTCRALDRFTEKLPRILKWAKGRPLFLFGGPSLAEALKRENTAFDARLLPLSEQRFLFIMNR